MAKRQALFRLDPGLLFVAAGLALCAAVVLLPAQRDLVMLQQQLAELQRQDDLLRTRLRITSDVIRELDSDNPELNRRLISSQLNLAPAGDTPIVLVTSRRPDVSEWVSARVRIDPALATPQESPVWRETALTRLVDGPYRLWVLGGSVLCVFIGLLHGTVTATATSRRGASESDQPTTPEESDDAATLDEAYRDLVDGLSETAPDEAGELDGPSADSATDDAGCEISTYPSEWSNILGSTAVEPTDRETHTDTVRFPKSLFD